MQMIERLLQIHQPKSNPCCITLVQTARVIGFQVNANKTKYMCFKREGTIPTLNAGLLKLIDKFTYLSSGISSTKSDINMRQANAWTAIDRLSIISNSDLSNKIKQDFFRAAVVSILPYGCTTWTLTKCIEKKLDANCSRFHIIYMVLWSSRYFFKALVPWLPHAFPASLFINLLCAHVVFERSTDGGWHILSGTSSDGRGDL